MKGDNNYLPFKKKITKASENNFKIDIKGISVRDGQKYYISKNAYL